MDSHSPVEGQDLVGMVNKRDQLESISFKVSVQLTKVLFKY